FVVTRVERDGEDLRARRAAVRSGCVIESGAEAELALGGERRRRETQRDERNGGAHQRPWCSGFSGRSGLSGRSLRAMRSCRSWRSAFSARITSPSLRPMVCAIYPQPLPSARSVRTPGCCASPMRAACSCAGVGLVMPCCFSLASASESAMSTSPLPILWVGGSNLVPPIAKSEPSRRPLTSTLALASEPASVAYLSASCSPDSASASCTPASQPATRMTSATKVAIQRFLSMGTSTSKGTSTMLKRGTFEPKAVGHARRGPVGPRRVSLELRCLGEREQEHNEVVALADGQLAPGMMAHHVAQRRDTSG